MNEGENSIFPQSPTFSSPNISSDDDITPVEDTSEPMPQAITSADISAMAGTDAGEVAATVAAMPEEDTPAAPAPITTSSANSRSRFGFGGRHFEPSAVPQQAATPSFAGAPDYFNQAAGDIMLASEGNEAKKSIKKKIIMIAGIAVAAIVLIAVAVIVLKGVNSTSVADAHEKLNVEDMRKVSDFENDLLMIANGKMTVEDITSKTFSDELHSNYEIYKKAYENIKGIKPITGHEEEQWAKNIESVRDRMKKAESQYSEIIKRYDSFLEAVNNGSDSLDVYSSNNKNTISAIVRDYRAINSQIEKYQKNKCESVDSSAQCASIANEVENLERAFTSHDKKTAIIFFDESSIDDFKANMVAYDIVEIANYLEMYK